MELLDFLEPQEKNELYEIIRRAEVCQIDLKKILRKEFFYIDIGSLTKTLNFIILEKLIEEAKRISDDKTLRKIEEAEPILRHRLSQNFELDCLEQISYENFEDTVREFLEKIKELR